MLKTITKQHYGFDGKYICLSSKQVDDNMLKQLKREFLVAKIKQGDVTTYLVCKTTKDKKQEENDHAS